MDNREKIADLTALIVGYNESRHLHNCISTLDFCSQIVYVDLGSEDNSVSIVKKFKNTTIINYSKTKIIEHVYKEIVPNLNCDWLLIMDPDERITSGVKYSILEMNFNSLLKYEKAVVFRFPEKYFFKGKHLKGTRWGGIKNRLLIFNKNYVEFTGLVHNGIKIKEDYNYINFGYDAYKDNSVIHFWCDGYRHFISKHLRYLKEEAESKFKIGERTRLFHLIKIPFFCFYNSYFIEKGFKDGLRGFFLSILWSWYNLSAYTRLYIYLKRENHKKKDINY